MLGHAEMQITHGWRWSRMGEFTFLRFAAAMKIEVFGLCR